MELRPLTLNEFKEYLVKSIKNYENELFASGVATKESARQTAQETFNNILPDGLNTKDNYLNNVYDENTLIGFIWYCIKNDNAFIYDFYIEEDLRRKGYGKKVILLCEKRAKEQGAKVIELHVFGHNSAARSLYESLNYIPTSIRMKKVLS